MLTTIILVLLVFFLYQFVKTLLDFEGGFAAFGASQWVQFALIILFVPLIVLTAIRAYKDNKANKEKQAEEMEKQQKELAARRRAKYLMDEGGFDETFSELDSVKPVDEDEFDIFDHDLEEEHVDIEEAAEVFGADALEDEPEKATPKKSSAKKEPAKPDGKSAAKKNAGNKYDE